MAEEIEPTEPVEAAEAVEPAEDEAVDEDLGDIVEDAGSPSEPGKVEPEPAKPEPIEPVKAEPAPATPTPAAPAAPAAPVETASQKRLKELEAQIDAEDFDPYSKDGKAIIKEFSRVAAKVEAEPLREQLLTATVWQGLADEHGIPAKVFRDEWDKIVKENPGRDQAVLDYIFEQRIPDLKKPKPAAPRAVIPQPATPRTPIKPRNGAVSPGASSVGGRPPSRTRDPAEDFAKTTTRGELDSL